MLDLSVGVDYDMRSILRRLVDLQYDRNDMTLGRGKFRVRGDTIEVHPSYEESVLRIEMFGDTVDRLTVDRPAHRRDARASSTRTHGLPGHPLRRRRRADGAGDGRDRGRAAGAAGLVRGGGQAARGAAPAHAHAVRPRDDGRGRLLQRHRELLDAHRRPRRSASRRSRCSTTSPTTSCSSSTRATSGRAAAARAVRGRPQPQGHARRARLPAAVGAATTGRCTFEEVLERINQCVFLSATPSAVRAAGLRRRSSSRSCARPASSTPRSSSSRRRARSTTSSRASTTASTKGDRVLVTTLTKKMAEDLTDYLLEQGLRVRYLHSNIDTIQRIEILRGLRLGEFDVLVGINLLREGLDLPEVSLVAILDADKEGFLRSRDVADPDDRPGRPQRRRPGRHVRRQGHRLDGAGDRRDQPPPRACRSPTTPSTASTRRRSARRSATSSRCSGPTTPRRCPARTAAASASGTRCSATSRRCRSRSWPG